MKQKKEKVIGVIMTYNCEELIEGLYQRIPHKVFDKLILVDDGSKDRTIEIAQKLGLTVFPHEHSGYGGNLKFGLKKALQMGADYIVEIHGDGQYDLSITRAALEAMKEKNYDFLLGTRFSNKKKALEDGMSLIRYSVNRLLSFFGRIVFGSSLTEFHSGYRIYSQRLLKTVSFKNTSDNYIYSFEIITQAYYHNLSVGEIPARCFYMNPHTSLSLFLGVPYVIDTFLILLQFKLARLGVRSGLFQT